MMHKVPPVKDAPMSRKDQEAIFRMIPKGARVLDLGCGSGKLLKALKVLKGARVTGADKHQDRIVECAANGVPVIQTDMDDSLAIFPDHAYDFVILSRTLQAVRRPDLVLDEMVRMGKTGIVSFLNFGYWRIRTQFSFLGTMPKTKALPYQWYDTPNIHLGTIADFRRLCRDKKIRIIQEIPFPRDVDRSRTFCRAWPNLFAAICIFMIEK